METQNVTLSIPKEILRKAKLLAVERNTSLSGLLTQTLATLVERGEAYAQAQARSLAWLDNPPALETGGRAPATREELHERSYREDVNPGQIYGGVTVRNPF